jgi:glycosyltransferase involved in cell wall biosynthesis
MTDLVAEVAGPYLPANARLHRVGNPIPVPDFGPKGEGVPGGFLFVGRLSPEKGVEVFLEAARRAGVTPTLVGHGPAAESIRARYPEAVMLGWKSPEEVWALMREARALVFPSVWYETQGLTAYEALAVGTPVIVSDVCAAREPIQDGRNGFWFRSGDVADLAAKMELLSDDDLARRMAGEAHAAYWAAPPTLDWHLDRLLEVYTEAATGRPGGMEHAMAAE